MLRNILIFILFTVIGAGYSYGQDPVFSVYYNAPLLINPAMTGNTFTPKLSLNYRNQWPGISQAYTTYTASYDQYIESMNSGVGGYILTDNAGNGAITTNKIGLSYAYSLELKNNQFIKLGIEPALLQTRLNWDKYIFGSQIDGETGEITPGGTVISGEPEPSDINKVIFDFSVGGVYYNEKFYFGIGAKHITSAKLQFIESGKTESILGIPIRFVVHTGLQMELKNVRIGRYKSYLSPHIMYAKQGPFHQINVGAEMTAGILHFGLGYRNVIENSDALILSTGVEVGVMKATYSFDFTLSGLGLGQGGSHEIGLMYLFGQKEKKQNYNDCFEIFR